MAKFTVFFKDKPLKSHLYDTGVIHIGRDETNDLVIDNLSVAPAHAVVIIKQSNCIIKQLSAEHPLMVNNLKHKETLLQNNDRITLGKHTIIYNTSENVAEDNTTNQQPVNPEIKSLNQKIENDLKIPDANFQVLEGNHIGRVLPLKKAMTRFGHTGSGIVIISKRKNGYFISSLEHNDNIMVNQEPLGDKSIFLKDNDTVVIDNISMRFFLEQ